MKSIKDPQIVIDCKYLAKFIALYITGMEKNKHKLDKQSKEYKIIYQKYLDSFIQCSRWIEQQKSANPTILKKFELNKITDQTNSNSYYTLISLSDWTKITDAIDKESGLKMRQVILEALIGNLAILLFAGIIVLAIQTSFSTGLGLLIGSFLGMALLSVIKEMATYKPARNAIKYYERNKQEFDAFFKANIESDFSYVSGEHGMTP